MPPALEFLFIPLSLMPLAFASAIVRYRLMDVEVIVKRALVYGAALSAIIAIYALLLRLASDTVFDDTQQHNRVIAVLATLVVLLVASPVKNAIQAALDRAFYRDRYDYRRALVGFARDLNSDLDLNRLSARLVTRVTETLLVDRMVLLLGDESSTDFEPIRTAGFTVLVFAQLFNCFNARSESTSAFSHLFVNPWLWGSIALAVLLQVAVVNIDFLNVAFGTVPLSLDQWLVCAAMASVVLWVSELRKLLVRTLRGDAA